MATVLAGMAITMASVAMKFGATGAVGADQSPAGDRLHGNEAYAKAATEEEDKLLNTKIKSICRGC